MSRPWPSGPDGQPLPADPAGNPVWPSEQYRRDYEQALAQRAAARDRRAPTVRTVLAIVVAIVLAVVVVGAIRDITQGPKQAQQGACQAYRDTGVTPPPDQECP